MSNAGRPPLRAAQTRRAPEERDRALSAHATDLVAILDADGTVRYVSPSPQRVLGYTSDEMQGRSGFDFVHPDDLVHVRATFAANVQASGAIGMVECRVRHADGSWRMLDVIGRNCLDDPAVRGIILTIRDITARKRLPDQRVALLAAASEELAASLDCGAMLARVARLAVPDLADWCMIDVFAEDGSLGQVAVAHVDPDREELVRQARSRHPPDPRRSHAKMKALRTGKPVFVPVVTPAWLKAHTRNDAHFRIMRQIGPTSYMCLPLVAHGRTLGALTLVSGEGTRRFGAADLDLAQDLACRVALAVDSARLYREAQQARAVAEAAMQTRYEFLTSAAHDLRGPLTTTMGRAQMVQLSLEAQQAIDPAWLRAQMDALRDASRRMLCAVDEMSDLASVELGHALQLDLEPVDVGLLLYTVAEEATTQHGPRTVDVEAPVGVIVRGDRARLERVLQNIIGNAIKYSAGRTPVRVEMDRGESGVTIAVHDRGVGIPEEELPHVFTRFYRASTAQGIPGTGIGLAASSAIVEQHGGQIALRSAVGQGTTVTISLPNAPP